MKKKAFTLIELIATIIATSIILSLSYTYYSASQWYSSVNDLDRKLFYIIDKGIMNTVSGYINSTGGDCSNNSDYTDLSAGRMIDCNDWNNTYPYSGIKSTDGTESYIVAFLEPYMPSGSGCSIYFDDKSADEFYTFIDCSNVNYDDGSDNTKKYLEQKVNSYMKTNFSTIYQQVDLDSTAIDNNTGGNDHDGKLRILFKK